MDSKLYHKVKELFPDAPEHFLKTMYHNINGKRILWNMYEEMNDDSNSNVK